MDGRKIVLLVAALLVAAVTAFMARSLVSGSAAPTAGAAQPVVIDGPEILVATRALPVGTILDATSMKFQPWPKELVEGAYFLKEKTPNLQQLQGTVVRFAIPAGQPLTQGALVKPGDRGFLAAALGPGMRAVTVPVSAQSSVAGFVFPGDRVDVILTQSVVGGGDGAPLKVAETVLRNLRVLATDQRTDKTTDDKGATIVNTYSTVTLETTPRIAEQIAVAQTVGTLSLSLRSIADNAGELEAAIASGSVDVPSDPKAEKAMLEAAARQPIEGRGGLSTGADVSRYQRRSVPAKPAAQQQAEQQLKPVGPVVKVARGNAVEDVEIGGRASAPVAAVAPSAPTPLPGTPQGLPFPPGGRN